MRITPVFFILCLLLMGSAGCNRGTYDGQEHFTSSRDADDLAMDSSTLIPVETFTSDYFPCSDCHNEMEPNTRRRELVEMHDDIVFDHDSENRWCLACHDTEDRDFLRLAGGQLLGFNESYKLCGQCHGPKYRDWKLGIHGKRTGEWNGTKQYLLCSHCHDPHAPKFKKLEPMPPPKRPEQIIIDSTYEKPDTTSSSP